jgi:phage gp29-like protein
MKPTRTASQANSPGFIRSMGRIMNRALASVSYRFHVTAANTWRDSYNPLRSLTITRAVSLLEEGERGAMSDLQWTYRYIEMQDATLGALVERRTSAIQELDWNIIVRNDVPEAKKAIAAKQEAALKSTYDGIKNLSAAFEHFALASFRGFSRLEKVYGDNGQLTGLDPVDQWFWVREGLYGPWKYNRSATFGTNRGEDVPEPRFITREVSRPINRVALIAFVRKGLSQKDWDGFIEAYGIPAVFVIMPDNVPEGKEDAYLDAADQVTSDARGVLPGGSDIKTVDNGARGNNPFKEHLAYQDEQVVLRGTGGKLTMLAESGSGTLAGGAHTDTFKAIARAEAAEISEILRAAIDAEVIAAVTPGEQAWAGFQLAANEEQDSAQVVRDVTLLNKSGFPVDPAYVEEKTGYKLRIDAPSADQGERLLNRLFNRLIRNTEDKPQPKWKKFARETGTLGVPRAIMPQIKSGNRAAMVNFLRARGIDYTKDEAKPADLKPTQAEYSPEKVEGAKSYEGTPRAILISSDNHIVDGHHQYMAALQTAPNVPIPVFRIKAPVMAVVGLILQMTSTEQALMNRISEDYDTEEDEAAPISAKAERDQVEQLVTDTLADALGVRSRVLAPIQPLITKLAGTVQDGRTSDADWLQLVEEAALSLPEFFDPAEAEELSKQLEAAMGTAVLQGARAGITNPSKK